MYVESERDGGLCLDYGLLIFAVLLLSIDALLILLVQDVSDWTLIFFRYAFMGFTILLFYFVQTRGALVSKFLRIGWGGVGAACVMAGSGLTFTLALLYTHVANVFLIVATTSLWASIWSYLLFGEIVPLRTIVAILVAFTAVAVVVGIELSSDLDSAWFGNVMAVISSILMSLYLVIVRGINMSQPSNDKIDFVPALVLSCAIQVVVAACVGVDLDSVTGTDLLYLTLMGVVVNAVGSSLLTLSTVRISAPEVALFMLLDTVLEPVWVYLAGLDTPPYYSLYAGAFVVAALGTNSVLALLEEAGQTKAEKDTGGDGETDRLVPEQNKNE